MARFASVETCRFLQDDAETFRDPEGFDLIIHFGTLYHLPDPVLALQTTLANLRPGGLLLLAAAATVHIRNEHQSRRSRS